MKDNNKLYRIQLEKYLTREGTGRDGNAAKLFGTDLEKYKKHMVGKNIRIVLSPESLNIDTEILAKQFIKNLKNKQGINFIGRELAILIQRTPMPTF